MKTKQDLISLTTIFHQRNQLKIYQHSILELKDTLFEYQQLLGKLTERAATLARKIDSEERQLFEDANLTTKDTRRRVPRVSKSKAFFEKLSKASGIHEREIMELLAEELTNS